jgi:hypothetical protein
MDKKLVSLLSLFFLSFGIFAAVVVFNKPLTQMTRATAEVVPSASNSLIFAWPLKAAADGKTEVAVTVFVRTESSKPVADKNVSMSTSHGTFKTSSVAADKEGKATFTLTADSPGTAAIEATIDGSTKLTQTLSVQFE